MLKTCNKITFRKKAFTLVELLVVISIIILLMGILMPSLSKARGRAKAVSCRSNLKQLGLGMAMYVNDSNGYVFPLVHFGKGEGGFGKYWYFGFEPLENTERSEGSRPLLRQYAKLYPYIRDYDSVEICPSFPYSSSLYKPKFNTRWMTYGINSTLSPNLTLGGAGAKTVKLSRAVSSTDTSLLFADSAMVNYWQKPASFENPMFEEWHYIEQEGTASAHFRHQGRANVLFADFHVDSASPKPDSFGTLLPEMQIGLFDSTVTFK